MTATTCVRCGRPMPDQAAVCHDEALELTDTLLTAAGHAEDAEAVLTRQARYGGGSRGGSGDPLPVDLTAAAGLTAIEDVIRRWTNRTLTERDAILTPWRPPQGPGCPHGWCEHHSCRSIRNRRPPTPLAWSTSWLAQHTTWLRKHPDAEQAFTQLHDACDALARLVDRPPDRDLVGMCDCGKVLYAAHGRSHVQCPERTCKLIWHVERSRDILRRALDEKLLTASEAARLAQYLDTDRTQEQIRKLINAWSTRSLVQPHGEIGGEPTFRFGDIALRLAQTPRRTPRTGVAA